MTKAIELFCGAGGTSFGFILGGYDVLLGVDFDPDAIQTFESNHPGAKSIVGDISKIKESQIDSAIKGASLDLLIGGPSCQGYSTIGKRIDEDPRNSLFRHYLRIVDHLRPKWIVFENVKGFLISGGGRFFKEFSSSLEKIGYDISAGLVNAADFGVPQRRERVIVIGNRVGIEPSLPMSTHEDPRCPMCSRPDGSKRVRGKTTVTHCQVCGGSGYWHSKGKKPWVNLRDAIGDLPLLADEVGSDSFCEYSTPASSAYQKWVRTGSRGYDLHRAKKVSPYALSIISKIPPGMGIRSIPESQLPDRFKIMRTVKNGNLRRDCTTLYHRLGWDMPSYTITCYFENVSSGAFTHPESNRPITVREAARLQSFPDRFAFNHKNVRRQIGNAVPPLLAMAIAEHIKAMTSGGKKPTEKPKQTKLF